MEHKDITRIEPVLAELKDDATVPKNVRLKIEKVIEVLKSNMEMSIKVSKVLNELEEIADDVNLQSYTRTQVWDIISTLEKIK
ncbi:MAG: UPF0147 family protein [Candidatus Woesearchaeota archaeon]|jgi:hypothetical protein|nr:hypothetical protein [Candidatus Woesearchaeota archaeon]MDP6600578.1 UPF0147 family protein [Candidatus Woesearchaeota archaeon]|tara:strand:- start:461 stop:709 length:249 start_codon:yes stop_codon:yes gene_type:complete